MIPCYIYLSCLLRLLSPVRFLRDSWLWWPWGFWRILVRYTGCPSTGMCLFSSWFAWSYGFGEKAHRGKVLFSSHHIKDTYYQYGLWWLMLNLIWSAGWSSCIVSPFPCCVIWKEVTLWSPHLKSGSYTPTRLDWNTYIIYLEFCVGDLFPLHLFIQSLICINMHSWIWFSTLGYNPVLRFKLSCSLSSNFGHWEPF